LRKPCAAPLSLIDYFRVTRPDVTVIELRPLDLQDARSCAALRLKNTVAVEREPLSEPAKDPFTWVEPPGLGNVNPKAPERLEDAPYSENVMRLGRIVVGVQVTLIFREFVVSTRLQAFDGLEMVAVALPPITLETLEPEVLHPFDDNVTAVPSALIPLVVSGGENASAPVILVHVILPVATMPVASLELEVQPLDASATNAKGRRDTDLHPPNIDMARALRRLTLHTTAFGRDGS